MSVKYNVVERANRANRAAPKKFYPSIVFSGRLTLRQLAKEIANISTISSAEALRATQIGSVLPRFNPGKEFKKVLDTIDYQKA